MKQTVNFGADKLSLEEVELHEIKSLGGNYECN
jgi:hypothetical protein